MERTALLAFAAVAGALLVVSPALAQDSDPNPAADEWIVTEQTVRFEHIPGGAEDEDGGPALVYVNGTVSLHQFQYQGDTYTADEFRDAYERGVIGDSAVATLEAEVQRRFNDSMSRTLPLDGEPRVQPAQLTQASLNAGTGGSTFQPPLDVRVAGEGNLDLSGVTGTETTPDKMAVAFDLGATFDLPYSDSVAAGHNKTVHLVAPAGLAWEETGGAEVTSNRTLATVEGTNWKGTSSLAVDVDLGVTDPTEKAFEEERVDLEVTADIQGIDVQVTKIPGGSLGQGRGNVSIVGDLAVVELPEAAPDSLTEAGVTHVSAADIRLLVDEGLVERSTIEEQVQNLTSGFAEETPEQVDVVVAGGLVDASLERSDDPPADETDRPVRVHFTADVFVDLSWRSSPGAGTQAVTLHTIQRTIPLDSIQGYETSYEVLLPKGVELRDVSSQTLDPTMGTTEDGRDFFTADVPAGEEHEATMQVAFTESTAAHQAPELVALLLLLLLIPLLVVARLVAGGSGEEEPTRVEAPEDESP